MRQMMSMLCILLVICLFVVYVTPLFVCLRDLNDLSYNEDSSQVYPDSSYLNFLLDSIERKQVISYHHNFTGKAYLDIEFSLKDGGEALHDAFKEYLVVYLNYSPLQRPTVWNNILMAHLIKVKNKKIVVRVPLQFNSKELSWITQLDNDFYYRLIGDFDEDFFSIQEYVQSTFIG